jgi:hypothetical protein
MEERIVSVALVLNLCLLTYLEEQLNVVYGYSLKRYSKSIFNLWSMISICTNSRRLSTILEDDNAESDGSSLNFELVDSHK